MAISNRFLAATALVAAPLLSGCLATTNGAVDYGTRDSGGRQAGTEVTKYHVRTDDQGRPTPVNYNACSEFKSTLRQMGVPARQIESAGNIGARRVGSEIGSGDFSGAGDAAAGAAATMAATYGVGMIKNWLLMPIAKQHEGNCFQENAYKSWEKDYKRWTNEFQRCVTQNTRGRTPMTPEQAGATCHTTVRPLLKVN